MAFVGGQNATGCPAGSGQTGQQRLEPIGCYANGDCGQEHARQSAYDHVGGAQRVVRQYRCKVEHQQGDQTGKHHAEEGDRAAVKPDAAVIARKAME